MAGSHPPASGSASAPIDSSSSSSSTHKPNNTSYLDMAAVDGRVADTADATLIGTHCEYEYCRQLDFLPFLCQSCRHTFCLDHRTESAHHCTHAGAWAARRREAELAKPSLGAGRTMHGAVAEKPCAAGRGTPGACKTVIGTSRVTGVHCANCRRDYCLKHRLREDHGCAQIDTARDTAAQAQAAKARSALDKLRAWGAAKKEQANKAMATATATTILTTRPAKQGATARIAALAALKKEAKGDAKIPVDKRLFLHVEAEAASTEAKLPKGAFFYHRDWVVGRVLDAAAQHLQIANINNRSSKEDNRLRLFHVEGGRLLDFGETAGVALANGNTVVLLRGVGPPPELIDL